MTMNFQKRFAPDVKAGIKTLTLRCSPTAMKTKVGDTVHLFTGMRTKNCRRLGRGVVTRVRWVTFFGAKIEVDGEFLNYRQQHDFAAADGFSGPKEQVSFFQREYGLPCDLVAIEWDLVTDGGAA